MNEQEILAVKAWNLLNSVDLINIEEQELNINHNLEKKIVEKYFEQISQYNLLDLTRIRQDNLEYIKNIGYNFQYLEANQSSLINCEEKKITSNYSDKERRNFQRINLATEFQLEMASNGYIKAVCPMTGQILSSNRSFPIVRGLYFYRFISQEVFYLITSDVWLEKTALYFPDKELIVILSPTNLNSETWFKRINLFKICVTTRWKKVKDYILNQSQVKIASIICINQFAHHLWNELSGIYRLNKAGLLNQVDCFLVRAQPLGLIENIFPEISKHKIQTCTFKEFIDFALEKNLFVLSLGGCIIEENLIKRIYKVSYEKSSDLVKTNIEEARKKHFPLLWVSIRLGTRTWVSQVQGISKIITQLYTQFPKLGVVFDGFSLPENQNCNVDIKIKETIEKEKETVKEIISLIPNEIGIYDIVGCQMHESVLWANSIDVYLTHQGSIQHKVGWIGNKPGVIHTNRVILRQPLLSRPGCWERQNGILPKYVSEQYITDLEQEEFVLDSLKALGGKKNYQCDWKAAYEELLELIELIAT